MPVYTPDPLLPARSGFHINYQPKMTRYSIIGRNIEEPEFTSLGDYQFARLQASMYPPDRPCKKLLAG
ncbi:hypothetical protein H9L39_00759 [Fusarium oxysporum f. sp. albedinis]|nr:hypothetical protein H9L39_00759 [Fusarium oxysporum f. sp. albedinis]